MWYVGQMTGKDGGGNECGFAACKFLDDKHQQVQAMVGNDGAMCVQDWRTCTHDPVAIFGNPDTMACFFEFKVL